LEVKTRLETKATKKIEGTPFMWVSVSFFEGVRVRAVQPVPTRNIGRFSQESKSLYDERVLTPPRCDKSLSFCKVSFFPTKTTAHQKKATTSIIPHEDNHSVTKKSWLDKNTSVRGFDRNFNSEIQFCSRHL
jgi:hypothetical protein